MGEFQCKSLVGFGRYSMEVGSKMYQQYDLQYLKSYTKIVIPTFTQVTNSFSLELCVAAVVNS